MTTASDRAKELRAELKVADAAAKEERLAQRLAEREARQAEEHRLTQEHRAQNYEATVGEDASYIGLSTSYTGGVVVDVVEWRTEQGEVNLSREEAIALIEALTVLVK